MKQMMRWTIVNMLLTVLAILIGLPYGPIRVASLFSIFEIALQIPLAIFFLGKTKLISTEKWYKNYILGLGLLAGVYCILQTIQNKLGDYALSPNTELGSMACVTIALSVFIILAIPESRNFLRKLFRAYSVNTF
jgi:hypothetical protein